MAEDMSAKWIIPMHWGSFKLSNEPLEEPIARFRQVATGQMEKVARPISKASYDNFDIASL